MRRTLLVLCLAFSVLAAAAAPAPAAGTNIRLARLEARTAALEKQVRINAGRYNAFKSVLNVLALEYICTPYLLVDNQGGTSLFLGNLGNADYFIPNKRWGSYTTGGKTFNCGRRPAAAAALARVDSVTGRAALIQGLLGSDWAVR